MATGTSNQLEIESIRKKYDKLLKVRFHVVLYNLPEHSIPITHSLIIKLKNKRWSTENLIDELPASLSLACFTPFANKKEAIEIQNEEMKISEEGEMNQPELHRSKINTVIHKSYKVNTSYAMLSTLSSTLAFLYNMVDHQGVDDVRPMLCDFLHGVLHDLTKDAGKSWLSSHKDVKQLPLCILSQIQQIIIYFLQAASDDDY